MSHEDLVPGLDRTLAILSAFRDDNAPRASSDLTRRLGIPRSTAYQIIQALLADGYLERAGKGRVQLGPRLVDLLIASRRRPRTLRPLRGQAAPRTFLWNPELTEMVNCARFHRSPPYRIGFSNASTSNPWRIALLRGMQHYAEKHSSHIAKFIVSDAQDDPDKQIADVHALLRQKLDILLVSCGQGERMDAALAAVADAGIPLIAVDRRPKSDEHFLTHVSASDIALGRVTAQWLVERLSGKGTIFMLSGAEGASPTERRAAAAMEVIHQYPDVSVAARRYTDWQEELGREVTHALIDEKGMPDGVWCDSGLQGAGSMRAFLDRGIAAAEIPAHTGGDVNHVFQLAAQHQIPLAAVEYPASMGARALQAALDVLTGKVIPRHIEVHSQVVVSRGDETFSVHADVFADHYVRWDRPADFVASVDQPP